MKTVHVSAAPTPFCLLVISSTVEEPSINSLRFGHAVPPLSMPPPVALGDEGKGIAPLPPLPYGAVEGTPEIPPKRFRHRPGCLGKAKGHPRLQIVKIKAIEISNYFRKVLGWPLIEVEHHRHHGHHRHHHNGGKSSSEAPDREGGFIILSPDGSPSHSNHKYFHNHGDSFMSRLHYLLMNLGLWEGRAVAFVIGLFSISSLRNTTSRRTYFFTGCSVGRLWTIGLISPSSFSTLDLPQPSS